MSQCELYRELLTIRNQKSQRKRQLSSNLLPMALVLCLLKTDVSQIFSYFPKCQAVGTGEQGVGGGRKRNVHLLDVPCTQLIHRMSKQLLKKVFIMPIHTLTKKAVIAYFICRLSQCSESLGSSPRLIGNSFGFSFRSLAFNSAAVIKVERNSSGRRDLNAIFRHPGWMANDLTRVISLFFLVYFTSVAMCRRKQVVMYCPSLQIAKCNVKSFLTRKPITECLVIVIQEDIAIKFCIYLEIILTTV